MTIRFNPTCPHTPKEIKALGKFNQLKAEFDAVESALRAQDGSHSDLNPEEGYVAVDSFRLDDGSRVTGAATPWGINAEVTSITDDQYMRHNKTTKLVKTGNGERSSLQRSCTSDGYEYGTGYNGGDVYFWSHQVEKAGITPNEVSYSSEIRRR